MEITSGTRAAIRRLLLERGPLTAPQLAATLSLTVPAVRRHLEQLVETGHAAVAEVDPSGVRGRGRPPRAYALTLQGRETLGSAYDELAVDALRFVAAFSPGAVRQFAAARAESLREQYESAVASAEPVERPEVLSTLLTADGYAATAAHDAEGSTICQHHCPVSAVAAEFPELCEAETEAFAALIGSPVTRHSTIAAGSVSCIAYVESTPVTPQSIPPAVQESA